MESDPKSAILFHMQLHPNESFPGEGSILFSLQGHKKPGKWRGADRRQFLSQGELLFPDSGAGVTLVFGSVINDQCTCVWVPREAFMLCGSLGGLE